MKLLEGLPSKKKRGGIVIRERAAECRDVPSLASVVCLCHSQSMGKRIQIPPGTLAMLILRTLQGIGPMHGYGIARHVQRTTEDVLQVEEGSLYPAGSVCVFPWTGFGNIT